MRCFRFVLRKTAALLILLGEYIARFACDAGEPKTKELPVSVSTPVEFLPPVKAEPQRELPDNKRKLLLLLAKEELTESEQAEVNALTAGREIIILEDT